MFNKSLAQASVPLEWKKTNVTPIFKKGDKKNKAEIIVLSALRLS